MTLILLNKIEWFGYWMPWLVERPIQRDYLLLIWKRKKWFFLKLTRTPHCKERFLHHKVLKEKFSSFSIFFFWISSFWNHHPDLIKGLCHHLGWPSVFQQSLELHLDLILPKRVRKQSIEDSVPIIWMTLCIGPTLELCVDLILLKRVRRQSIKDSVPIICMTFG